MMRVLMLGDLGGRRSYHAGDEAMFAANVDRLRATDPAMTIDAPSRDPESTAAYGVEAFAWPSLEGGAADEVARRWSGDFLAAVDAGGTLPEGRDRLLLDRLRACDALVISGGGNLNASWPGHFFLRVALLEAARRLAKRTVVLGQSIGPHLSGGQSETLSRTLGAVDLVVLREENSMRLARRLGIEGARLRLGADDALGWSCREPAPSCRPQQPFVAVCLAGEGCRDAALARQLGEFAARSGCRIVLVPQSEPDGDADLARAAAAASGSRAGCEVLPLLDSREIGWVLGRAEAVISARYHGVVFALDAGVPPLALYNDAYTAAKIGGALGAAGLAGWGIPTGLASLGGLLEGALELWERRAEISPKILAWRSGAMAAQADLWREVEDLLLRGRVPGNGAERNDSPASSEGIAAAIGEAGVVPRSPWLLYGERLARSDVDQSLERTVLSWMQHEAARYAQSLKEHLASAEEYARSLGEALHRPGGTRHLFGTRRL